MYFYIHFYFFFILSCITGHYINKHKNDLATLYTKGSRHVETHFPTTIDYELGGNYMSYRDLHTHIPKHTHLFLLCLLLRSRRVAQGF